MINQQDALGETVLLKKLAECNWIIMGPKTPVWTSSSESQAQRLIKERWFNYVLQTESHGSKRMTDHRRVETERFVKRVFNGESRVTC